MKVLSHQSHFSNGSFHRANQLCSELRSRPRGGAGRVQKRWAARGFSVQPASPLPHPQTLPPSPGRVWRMDAALNETFLPRGAQGSLKVERREEKNGVKKREGVASLGVGVIEPLPRVEWGLTSNGGDSMGWGWGSFLLTDELCVEDLLCGTFCQALLSQNLQSREGSKSSLYK